MAAGDTAGRGLICKHPSKGLKKARAHLVIFKAEVRGVGASAALKMDDSSRLVYLLQPDQDFALTSLQTFQKVTPGL